MTLLTKFKARRELRKMRTALEWEFLEKGVKFFETQDEAGLAVDRIGKVAEMLSRVASDLSNYLLTATKESETNRKVLEEKLKKEEAEKPSKYDAIY